MSVRTWHAVDVVVRPPAVEAVESAFNQLNALGTEVDGLRKPPDEPLCVTGFFDTAPDEADVRAYLEESLRICDLSVTDVQSVSTRNVEQVDWLAEWKKHWHATEAGKFVIAPPWEDVPPSDKILIRVEPNMAFGTGTHETTRLCLDAIGRHYTPDQSFMDVGTGTGILAIAAAKLGGTTLLGCDTDEDSVGIARENARLNGVNEQIQFSTGSIDAGTPTYDFVCANLTLDVIMPLLQILLSRSRRMLVLSGILAEQQEMIEVELRSANSSFQVHRDGEWISVLIDRVS